MFLLSLLGLIVVGCLQRGARSRHWSPTAAAQAPAGFPAPAAGSTVEEKSLPGIGVVLPLSGRGQEVGQEMLRGIELAQRQSGVGMKLLVRDDGSDALQTQRWVQELAARPEVVVVVGLAHAEGARRAAALAEPLGLPMVILAPAASLPSLGSMVFRAFATPREEADLLVGAAGKRLARRIAVLHPDNGFGRAMAQVFQQAVATQQLQWAGAASYAPEATSYGDLIRRLRKLRFDAVVFADGPQKIALLAPALAASSDDRKPTPLLLLPSVAYSPALISDAGRYLQGALMTLPTALLVHDDPSGGFPQAFATENGHPPNLFAAYSFGAMTIVEAAIYHTRGAVDLRLAVTAALAKETATASTARMHVRLLQLHGDSLEPLLPPLP